MAETSLLFWREILGLGYIKTGISVLEEALSPFPQTHKSFEISATRFLQIDSCEANRVLGRSLVFYRTHQVYEATKRSHVDTQRELVKLSDEVLTQVLGFDPGQSFMSQS